MGFFPFAPQFLSLAGGTLTGALSISGAFPAGAMLTLTNTSAAPTDADLIVIGAASGDRGIGVRVSGDTFSRALFGTDGSQKQSSGSGAADVVQTRGGVGLFQISTGNLDVSAAGSGLRVAEGANAKQGTAVLVAGTVTVANTSVTANSKIAHWRQVLGGTVGHLSIGTITAGTSFVINSSSATDTSTVGFEIFEPG